MFKISYNLFVIDNKNNTMLNNKIFYLNKYDQISYHLFVIDIKTIQY
jgi:hypothetical protein